MNTIELIRKKRDNEILTTGEIEFLVKNFTKGKIPDYQFASFLMALFFNGMNKEETSALTHAMLHSGKIIDLSAIEGVKVDKHSTGGVGDKTSLILAPIAAAAGIKVPMISGRGLGHSGGTLDKLESIPGFNTGLDLHRYKYVIKKCGAVLIGQTKDIAPADKAIYALRDVTATVNSIPLIVSSIMSKKLAEGIDGLVLDVKTGSGAFMKTFSDSQKLAEGLVETAVSFDKKVIAFITDMNQPLGNNIGNWLEVVESIEVLQGNRVDDLLKITLNLAAAMLKIGGKVESIEEGIALSTEMIKSGKALDKFLEIVKLQGGDSNYLKDLSIYPKSKYSEIVTANREGFIGEIDTYRIGMAAIELGAGRKTKEDVIDPKAGMIFKVKIGDKVKKGTPIAELFTDKKTAIEYVIEELISAISIVKNKPSRTNLIKKIIDQNG